MLLAYIDEIGEPGAFVAKDHPRFHTSPAFGYAGFVIPEVHARRFGTVFTEEKRRVFRTEIERASNPGQWERKGSSIFRPDTLAKFPQQVRVFNGLVRKLRSFGGNLFYYAHEKPLGTPAQTRLDTAQRETSAMQETLNRLARHADSQDGSNLMVMIDQINENQRSERVPNMYAHILGRASSHPEMRRIIEPPMHVDSVPERKHPVRRLDLRLRHPRDRVSDHSRFALPLGYRTAGCRRGARLLHSRVETAPVEPRRA
ncbi:DUF3800 domain-containing protein [Agrococcus lahaulensis]|uniref:DUF3800 domain-containing protein n=1 Tax=Agrococcus lahaulensis TaxID=341722 RepID=UPI001FDFD1E9|nr:DUF3800 domain-containing protein [Agrococcus lahaulensis]